jgi:trehalose 6-phosphate phosphatase
MTPHALLGARAFEAAVGARLDGSPLAVMLDLDGTLAPIAPRPQDARVPEATRAVLRELVGMPQVHLALVSGRSAGDAAWVASVEGAWVLGNHGAESRSPSGDIAADEAVRPYEASVSRAARALGRIEASTEGAILEDKRWTLSLHYRLVDPAAVPALLTVAREVAEATGLRVTEGKKVIELRPPVDIHKGTATVAFADRIGANAPDGAVLFAGDDRTDEDAFRALRRRKESAVTVRVAGAGDDPIDTNAEFALESPEALREALHWLAARRAASRPAR